MKKLIITLLLLIITALSVSADPIWEKKSYNVYVKPNPKSYIMKKAFNRWQALTNREFRFIYVDSEDEADIISDYVENLPDMAVGVCYRSHSNGKIIKARIELAQKNKFKTILTDDEYYRIMLHEIGHALGLNHSKKYNSIMRPYTGEITNISIDDRKALQELYD